RTDHREKVASCGGSPAPMLESVPGFSSRVKQARRLAAKDSKSSSHRPARSPFERPALRHTLAICALVLCAVFVYSNSFHAPLVLDNDEIILKDPRVHSTSGFQLHRILTGQYWETAPTGLYRPLTTLSYLLNYTILGGGSDPVGYHWLNFLVHAANMAL